MTANFKMFVGDTAPPLTVELTELGKPLDVSEAASVSLVGYLDGVEKFNRTAELIAPDRVSMSWAADDTDEVGTIHVFAQVSWPDTSLQTVETDNVVVVQRIP